MTDLRVLVLSSLTEGPLPRHLPANKEGRSIERVLHGQASSFEVARGLAECQSGPWPMVERTDYGWYRLTPAGDAHLRWWRWSQEEAS